MDAANLGTVIGQLSAQLGLDVSDFLAQMEASKLSISEFITQTQQKLASVNKVFVSELEGYRAVLAAEQLRNNRLREEMRVRTDYANLTSRLRAQEITATRELSIATSDGYAQEARFRAERDAVAAASQREYTQLVASLKAQEVAGVLAAEREITANIEAEIAKRVASEKLELQIVKDLRIKDAAEAKAAQAAMFPSLSSSAPSVGARLGAGGVTPHVSSGGVGMAVGAAGLFGMYESAKLSAEFDDSMNKSLSIMGNVSDFMQNKMRKAAIDLSNQYGISSKEIAEAFYHLASAGMSAEQSLDALPTVVKFAFTGSAKGIMDMSKSAELLTTVVNALQGSGGDINRIANLLIRADQIAAGTGEQFAQSLAGKGSGSIRILGKSVEEGLAILATYAKLGIRGADAQQSMVQVLRDFRVQAEKHASVMLTINGHQLTFGQLVYDNAGKMRNLGDIIGDLEKLFQGASSQVITHDLALMGLQQRTTQALQPLIGFSKQLKIYQQDLHDTSHAMDDVEAARMKSPITKFDQLLNRVKNLAISFASPLLEAWLATSGRVLSFMAEKIQFLFDKYKEFINFVTKPFGDSKGKGLFNTEGKPDMGPQEEPNKPVEFTGDNSVFDPKAEEKARKKAEAIAVAVENVKSTFKRMYNEAANNAHLLSESANTYIASLLNNIQDLIDKGVSPNVIRGRMMADAVIIDQMVAATKRQTKEAKEASKEMDEMVKGASNLAAKLDANFDKSIKGAGKKEAIPYIDTHIRDQQRDALLAQKYIVDLREAYKTLGITIDETTGEVGTKVVDAFELMAKDAGTNLEIVEEAWTRISTQVNKLAKYDLPLAIGLQNTYLGLLRKLDAPIMQQAEAYKKLLQMQIAFNAEHAKDSDKQYIDLVNADVRMKALSATTNIAGKTYEQLADIGERALGGLARTGAQLIRGATSIKEAWHNTWTSFSDDILTLVIVAIEKMVLKLVFAQGIMAAIGGIFSIGTGGGGAVASMPFASFDVGTDYVPYDQLAWVHKGERITPAAKVAAEKSNDWSGGNSIHVSFGSVSSGVSNKDMNNLMNRAIKAARRVNFKG